MEHHVCKGTCGHVSDTPGICGTEDCTNKGKAFEECGCGDKESHSKSMDEGGTDEILPPDNQ